MVDYPERNNNHRLERQVDCSEKRANDRRNILWTPGKPGGGYELTIIASVAYSKCQ